MLNASPDKELEERITYRMTSFLKKETWSDVERQNRKERGTEPLDQSHLRKTLYSQPAFTHTSPHSTIHGGGRGLLEILPMGKLKVPEIKEYAFGEEQIQDCNSCVLTSPLALLCCFPKMSLFRMKSTVWGAGYALSVTENIYQSQ